MKWNCKIRINIPNIQHFYFQYKPHSTYTLNTLQLLTISFLANIMWQVGIKNRIQTIGYIYTKIRILDQAACVRHACLRAPCVAWPLLSPTFALSLSLSLFLRLLLLTHFGECPMCEIIFHPIFWHN